MDSKTSGKRVVINSIIYTVSGLLMKCFSFFLLPLYTIYLTTNDYGITSITASFISTMSFVVSFSLCSAVTRFYVDLKEDPERLKRFYGTVVVFIFISSSTWVFVFLIGRTVLQRYVFSGIDFYPIILITLVTLIFDRGYTIYDTILKSQQLALKSSIVNVCYFFCNVGLNILLVVFFKKGAIGVVLSTLIVDAIFTVVFLIDMVVHRQITFCIDFHLLKPALRYSIPIMPHNLSTQVAMLISKVLIGNTGALSSLGIYSVGTQLGNIADTIQNYVNNAYHPWLFENLHSKETNYKSNIRNIVNILVCVIGLFIIIIGLFSQDYVLLLLDNSYSEAWVYIPFILTVFIVKIPYYFYVSVLFFYKKSSKLLFTATMASSVINVFLSFILVPRFSVMGSILADIIAMIVRVSIIYLISRKVEDIGLRISDFLVNIGLIMTFMFCGLSLSYVKYKNEFSIINFMFKSIIIILYILLLLLRYREMFINLWKKYRSKKAK